MHQRNHPALTKYAIIAPVLAGNATTQTAALEAGLSRRTVERWLLVFHQIGMAGLSPARRADRQRPRSANADWQLMTEALALSRPAYGITDIHRWICERAKKNQLKPPGYHAVHRWYKQIDPALITMATHGMQTYQHQHELVHRWESSEPNALWQADHTLLDVQVIDEKGVPARPWLTLIEDDYSRAICGYMLSTDHPNALQTALALRHAIRPKTRSDWPVCGLPARLYTDRGRDFISDHLEEICLRLHIQVIRSRPRQPRGKGKVERLFNTLNTSLLRTLPGYTKTPVGSHQDDALLTLSELDHRIETFITEHYHRRLHQTTAVTPIARWLGGGFLPQLPTDWSLLDELLLTVQKPRKVQRDGIQFRGLRYLSTTLAAYVGESVTIRYDPRDLAEIRVYYKEEFLGRALCQALTGQVVSLKEIDRARRTVRGVRKTRLEQARQHLKALESERVHEPTELAFGELPTEPFILLVDPTRSMSVKLYAYGHRS